jgi:hypothetical protein
MTLNQEVCQCGHSGVINPVWHGWNVVWQEIKEGLSPETQNIIKHQHVCESCKNKVHTEIESILKSSK